MKQKSNGIKIFTGILSLIASLGTAVYCGYLSVLQNYWFITICVYFALEILFIFISMVIKDEYKAMRVQGVFQIIGVLYMLDYLLAMILWNDSGTMVFLYSYFAFGAAAFMKGLTALINHIGQVNKYDACLHAFRNNDLITLIYFALMIELVIFKQFYPTTSFFDKNTLFVYIVEVATNATLTLFGVFFALSTAIYSKERTVLSPIGKIKHTIKWFVDNEISIYFGTIFTLYLAFLAFVNGKPISIFLGVFYLVLALIRFINFIWHKIIKKHSDGNQVKENRQSAWILLFDSASFLALGVLISIAAIALMAGQVDNDTNAYMFLFFIVPFAILRFIMAHVNLKRSRTDGNTYQIALGYISLLAALFSSLEVFAICFQPLSSTPLKITLMVILVVALQIALHIICITLFIFWIKGLIQNRRGKEKASKKA